MKILITLLAALLAVLLFVTPVWLLWNAALAPLGVPRLGFWQTGGLILLLELLGGLMCLPMRGAK